VQLQLALRALVLKSIDGMPCDECFESTRTADAAFLPSIGVMTCWQSTPFLLGVGQVYASTLIDLLHNGPLGLPSVTTALRLAARWRKRCSMCTRRLGHCATLP